MRLGFARPPKVEIGAAILIIALQEIMAGAEQRGASAPEALVAIG
ncbi:hypothetical protein E1H18_2427 [Caulobacter sp. RHG1]|nr:hypothetical protein [Caulobacter sp. RHG1]